MYHKESLIIHDTIKNNVIFDQKIEDEKYFEKVCKCTGIDEFINNNENSHVGDGGNLISDQKQRIAIARSLIRKPKILILDESFNALHEEAEIRLIENIKKIVLI